MTFWLRIHLLGCLIIAFSQLSVNDGSLQAFPLINDSDSTEGSELFMGGESAGIRVKRVPGDLEDDLENEESDENEALRTRKKIAKKRRTNKQGRTGRVQQQKHVHNHYHHNGAKSSGANNGGTKKKHSTGTVAAVAGILGTLGLLVGNGMGQAQAAQPWMPPMGMGMGLPPPPFLHVFR